jgi:hypothetical protein
MMIEQNAIILVANSIGIRRPIGGESIAISTDPSLPSAPWFPQGPIAKCAKRLQRMIEEQLSLYFY